MREAEELLGVLFQFYKPWQMARLLSCKQRRVSNIWDNHSRILGVNLYGLFASWEDRKWTYSGSIKEAASAKFILRRIKILFTLRPWCLVAKKQQQPKKTNTKKQLFTLGSNITPAHANKKTCRKDLGTERGRGKNSFCVGELSLTCAPPPPLPPRIFLSLIVGGFISA